MFSRRPVGILLGYLADVALGDPRRGHPVAGFGTAAGRLERLTYRDSRAAGALHTALLLIPVGAGAAPAGRSAAAVAAATWVSLGGTSLARTGLAMADLLDADDVDGAREVLPSLCGRDPAFLDRAGLTRAALESIAENTSDAQVAPVLWAAVGGSAGGSAVPGGQHARRDDRAPLAAVRAIRLGGSALGRCRQLRRGSGHRRTGGRVRATGRRVGVGGVARVAS